MPCVAFKKIRNTDLEQVTVVAQCLDNQWVSRNLLFAMLERGWPLNHPNVISQRNSESRNEYLRSILNAQQVIVNRAFFFNNPIVYRDFVDEGESRAAFTDLLSNSVIVPYLARETCLKQGQDFTVQPEGWKAWLRVVDECNSSCLRLSWDDDENADYVHESLERPFHEFLLSMATFTEEGLKRDFALDDDGARNLKAQLREVAAWAAYNEANRETFYRRFVIADDTKPADGCYDRAKPFAGQLKQLADLRYNTNLADAVDRYALTPIDSLHRDAMQEIRRMQGIKGVDQNVLLGVLLRRHVFDLVQGALNVGLTGLDLHHVWQARKTDEWEEYTKSLKSLINAPEGFETLGQAVYTRYADLANRVATIVGDRRQGVVDRWEPIIQVSVETLGSVISIVYDANPYIEVIGKVAGRIAARASVAVVRFAIVGRDQRRASAQLGTSFDLMRVRFERTGQEWEALVKRLKEAGYPAVEMTREPEVDANLDAPETSGDDD